MAATMATQKAGRKLASPQDVLNSGESFFYNVFHYLLWFETIFVLDM